MARYDSNQREKILKAAIRVFAEKGFRGATTRDVGRVAEVNSALLYYYFENKTKLFEESVRYVVGGFLDHLQRGIKPMKNARERITMLVDGIFSYYEGQPDRMELMQLAVTRHPEIAGRVLQSYLKQSPLTPIHILLEGMNNGELRPQHPMQVWWSLLSLGLFSFYLFRLWDHIGEPPPGMTVPTLSERKEHIIDLLLNGLVTEKSNSRRNI